MGGAALMHNSGTLFAFDKDAQRATSMRSSMARLGASCVHVQHADFLSVLPGDPKYTQVCRPYPTADTPVVPADL